MTEPCAQAPHPPPAHLLVTYPPLADLRMDLLTSALAAVAARCRPCAAAHRGAASGRPLYVHQAVTLFLVYGSILLSVHGRHPGETGETLVRELTPDTLQALSTPSVSVLRALPVAMATGPDGAPAATWEKEQLGALVAALKPLERARVWNDMLGLLTGLAQGEARARAEDGS